MGQILAYAVSAALPLLAMYIIYKWLLASENQYRYNRIVLLSMLLCAFVILPLGNHFSHIVTHDITPAGNNIPVLPQPSIINSDAMPSTWPRIAIIIYIAGITAVMAHTAVVWTRIARIIKSGRKIRSGRYTVVITDKRDVAPFSWCRYIVMSQNDYEQAGEMIKAHEHQHLNHRHWIDLLLAQCVIAINWFNPAAWLVREELKAVHEYEADKAVLDSGINARDYQLLLIKKAAGAKFPAIANSLNHSKLKKRMTMMMTSRSSKMRRLRTLAALPAVAVAIFALNQDAVASALTEVSTSRLLHHDDGNEDTAPIITETAPTPDVVDDNKTNGLPSDIVVIGYGTQPKAGITPKAAKAPSAQYSMSSESPRIFIDGVEVSNDELNTIDPNTIKSISVNKDDEPKIYVTLKDEVKQ